jgi:hypothetical protein
MAAKKLDMMTVVVQSQDTMRHARQFLEGVQTAMMGAFVALPQGSKWAVLMAELQDAEATLQEAMMEIVKEKK